MNFLQRRKNMKTKLFVLLISMLSVIFMLPVCVFAQSTSPNPLPELEAPALAKMQLQAAGDASDVITFSEFPIGTPIDDQYQDVGIIFGGSGPFISTDGANPTSPVLSGTPRFQGDITGSFVEPGTARPTVVQSFTFDAGYFDEFGSTRIEWFDPDGKKLGQRINSRLGIEQLTFEGGNIASWRIGIVKNEPAGYAIDNVFFVPIGPSVLFREKSDDNKDGSWGFEKDEIPGFDHSGFQMGNIVYESHPPYDSGTYVSADGQESVTIVGINGVQSQFSRATFEHDSTSTSFTPVVDFEEIPVEEELAGKMRNAIESVQGWPFQFIDYSLDGLEATLSPATQKGGDGSFTCVGLIEWAAEQAGRNGGEGFIRNSFESFTVPDPRTFPPGLIEVPLLSPQLLNYAMKGQQLLQDVSQWLQGLFDPVDFIVTDPLGRKLGFVHGMGFFNEIPNAFYSGNGGVEQFLIPNAIPGTYTVELVGTDADVFAAVGASGSSESFNDFLAQGETSMRRLFVKPKAGTGGDVDGDGDVDSDDIQALIPQLNRFTDGLGNPGDLDGDGLLSDEDLALLTKLVGILEVIEVDIDVLPGSEENPVNPSRKGVIPVAILGSDAFDVETIDLETLRFGPAGASPAHATGGHFEDVNEDGVIDLVSHYPMQETGIVAGLEEACVTAATMEGQAVKGCDRIRIIGR
jgi:hypothetical protein